MSNVMTPVFRVSYPSVFKPKKNELNGKDEYSLVALFPKGADLSKLKVAAQKAIEEKWGKDKAKWPANLKSPFRDQAERVVKDKATGQVVIDSKTGEPLLQPGHEKGAIFLTLKSKERPGVVDQSVTPILEESQFYAGCYAQATVRAYAYDNKGNRGVAFGLQNIQKVKDGEPLSGRSTPEQDFAPIAGGGGDEAATTATDLFN